MTENFQMKGKALDRDSIILLLDLISKHKIITTKSMNAKNNRLKEEAWKSIAEEFNELTGDSRRVEQLRLKWENLKKATRKRISQIRQYKHKMGGGKSFIPRNEILDRVASILISTCTGSPVEVGRDVVKEEAVGQDLCEASMEVLDFKQSPEQAQSCNMALDDGDLDTCGGSENDFTTNGSLNTQREPAEEAQRPQRDKDLGLMAYFHLKAEKVGLEKKKIELENRKLQLETKKLELENIKLELEIRHLKQKMNYD